EDISCLAENDRLRIATTKPAVRSWGFRLRAGPMPEGDVFLACTVAGAPLRDAAPEIGRLIQVALPGSDTPRLMTWAGEKEFGATFYFANAKAGDAAFEFTVEGAEPIWISAVSVHAAPDVVYRPFEHGLVLANPAPHPATIDLAALLPGLKYRRL